MDILPCLGFCVKRVTFCCHRPSAKVPNRLQRVGPVVCFDWPTPEEAGVFWQDVLEDLHSPAVTASKLKYEEFRKAGSQALDSSPGALKCT